MTREEAINRLEWLRMVGNHVDSVTLGKEDMAYFDMAISALREQPRWISVEERLPEGGQGYFIVWSGSCNYAGEAVWDGYTFRWIANDDNACATHWMPLPEPPEVEV